MPADADRTSAAAGTITGVLGSSREIAGAITAALRRFVLVCGVIVAFLGRPPERLGRLDAVPQGSRSVFEVAEGYIIRRPRQDELDPCLLEKRAEVTSGHARPVRKLTDGVGPVPIFASAFRARARDVMLVRGPRGRVVGHDCVSAKAARKWATAAGDRA
jgi:hypothetical protein